jgi:ribose 5-phosphate isomerase B
MQTNSDNAPIIIGSDHAAYPLKEILRLFLEENGFSVSDAGTYDDASVDYPNIAKEVSSQISQGKFERGILLCGTGLGMSMVANKYPHVRAALCNDLFSAKMSKRHNNANILVLGGRIVGDVLAIEIVKAWLNTPFEGGRHQRRLDQFECIDGE